MAEAIFPSQAHRSLRWVFRAAVLTVGLSLFTGCQLLGELTSGPTPAVAVTGVVLNKGSTALLVGATEQLAATVLPANAANQSVVWLTNNANVATVNAQGLVTGTGPGTAEITVVTNEGAWSKKCIVTVSNADVPVTGIVLKHATSLFVGGYEALLPTIVPAGATNQNVLWSVSPEGIVSVDANGVITGLTAGMATVTATTADGAFTNTCDVTVSDVTIAVTGVTLDITSTTLLVGASETLTATVAPADATTQNVQWSVLPEGIASVDAAGVVTGLTAGTATVTATSVDGSFTVDCDVTVVNQGTASVGFTWGSFQSVQFGQTSVALNSSNRTVTLSLQGSDTGTQWQWFIDGEPVAGATSDTYLFAPVTGGSETYTVSVTVVRDGVLYSGSINVTAYQTADNS